MYHKAPSIRLSGSIHCWIWHHRQWFAWLIPSRLAEKRVLGCGQIAWSYHEMLHHFWAYTARVAFTQSNQYRRAPGRKKDIREWKWWPIIAAASLPLFYTPLLLYSGHCVRIWVVRPLFGRLLPNEWNNNHVIRAIHAALWRYVYI